MSTIFRCKASLSFLSELARLPRYIYNDDDACKRVLKREEGGRRIARVESNDYSSAHFQYSASEQAKEQPPLSVSIAMG